MQIKKMGQFSVRYETPPSVSFSAAAVGPKEGEGPLKDTFDLVSQDEKFGQKTWEKAESDMQRRSLEALFQKSGLKAEQIDCLFGGDLLNQCIATAYGVVKTQIPFVGLYGACSTMAESMLLSAHFIDGGFVNRCIAMASSHFCSAERQYRFPLYYGGQRPPTAQWTATGAGTMLIEREGLGPYIVGGCFGRIVDMGICDANNMGAAMAPAAIDTIERYLLDSELKPDDFDLIVTGDLGQVGYDVVRELMPKYGWDITKCYDDCGMLLYDRKTQDVHAGGSGCGCSAIVMSGDILTKLRDGVYQDVLFVGTGALMSPMAVQQGESVMGIAHAVHLCHQKGER